MVLHLADVCVAQPLRVAWPISIDLKLLGEHEENVKMSLLE